MLLYFIGVDPGKAVVPAVFDGLPISSQDDLARSPVKEPTPSGSPGMLFARNPFDKPLAYSPKVQEWLKVPGRNVWVGYYRDAKPTPESLARGEQLAGAEIELGDGHDWVVPIVRVFPHPFDASQSEVFLPRQMTLNEAGEWVPGRLIGQHQWLLDTVSPYWDPWHEVFMQAVESGNDDLPVDLPDNVHQIAAKVLSANYYIGEAECALLGLFNTREMQARQVVEGCCSIPVAVLWWLKKKEAESSGQDIALGAVA